MSVEQSYINGFVKRASEYGLGQREAIELLKQSGFFGDMADKGKAMAGKAYEALQGANAAAGKALGDPMQKNVDNSKAFNETVKKNYNNPAPVK